MAARAKVVEKSATVAGEGRRRATKGEGLSSVAAGLLRANMLSGFVLAIVGDGWVWRMGLRLKKVEVRFAVAL